MESGKNIRDELLFKKINGYDVLNCEEVKEVFAFCEDYKNYMDASKTEREAVDSAVAVVERAGFVKFDRNVKYKAADKIYVVNRGKNIAAVIIGNSPLEEGIHLVASHADVPHLDLKQRSLYEDNEQAMFKTHYYGGVRKYQWVAIPLALHGVAFKQDGSKVNICIGEDESEPVFYISDLLPHLAKDQITQPLSTAFKGEGLNAIAGSRPFLAETESNDNDDNDDKKDKGSNRFKLNVIKIINEKYGLNENDLITAELQLVPAGKARDVGIDRSLIGAFGHDDRVCGYTSLRALIDAKSPSHTSVALILDKEETGSNGVTGAQSTFYKDFVADLCEVFCVQLRDVLRNSKVISADVTNAYDPNYADVSEPMNAAYFNYGTAVCKYVGHGGKGGTNDANAEYMNWLTRLFNNKNVLWQSAEIGKVDQGGGGTVAMFFAQQGMETIDMGVPVQSMHAPMELVSKLDTYMTYKAMREFYLG